MLNAKPAKQSRKFFASWQKTRSVLLLADEAQLPDLEAFIKKSEADHKTVLTGFVYKGKPEQPPGFDHAHIAVSKKSFGFFKLPKEEVLAKFNTGGFDVLVNLGEADQLTLLALSKLTDAACKIARFEHPVFDISISAEKPISTADYLQQVYTYLNMIKND